MPKRKKSCRRTFKWLIFLTIINFIIGCGCSIFVYLQYEKDQLTSTNMMNTQTNIVQKLSEAESAIIFTQALLLEKIKEYDAKLENLPAKKNPNIWMGSVER